MPAIKTTEATLTHSLRHDLLLRRGCSGAAALAALAAYQSYTQ